MCQSEILVAQIETCRTESLDFLFTLGIGLAQRIQRARRLFQFLFEFDALIVFALLFDLDQLPIDSDLHLEEFEFQVVIAFGLAHLRQIGLKMKITLTPLIVEAGRMRSVSTKIDELRNVFGIL